MATPKTINRQLDPGVLAQMEEPIRVTVSRIVGNARTPLTLPPREDPEAGLTYAPGEGWARDHISKLEGWLVTDFSGGGLYNIKIVDSKGLAFEWQPYFDPKTYPMRVPHTMVSAMTPTGAIVSSPPPPTMISEQWPPAFAGGTPIPSPTSLPSQVPSMTFPYPYGYPTVRTTTVDEDKRRLEDERKTLNDRIAQLERERLEEKHRADLTTIRSENDRKIEELKLAVAPKIDDAMARRLDALENAITKIVDRLTAAPSGPSPELTAMQEHNRKLEARLEAEQAERRHNEQLGELRRQNEETSRRLETIAARPTGPDPMFTLLVDVMKDGQRESKAIMDSMARQMLTPQDVLNLAKSTSSGLEDLKSNVVRMFSEVFDLQKRAFETAAQMLPQGESPVIRVIEGVVEKAGTAFEEWQKSKDAGQVAQAKAVTAQAKMNEAAINAQRDQLSEMARREEAMRVEASQRMSNVQRNAAHVPSRTDGQLAGPTMTDPVAPTNGATPGTPPSNVIPFTKSEEKRLGKTDTEWFGGALIHVENLRAEVAKFLMGISTEPPTLTADGKPVGIPPETAAMFVIESAATIVQQNIHVPAFAELYLTERWEDFAMVLLPNAPVQYRNAMLEIIADAEDEDDDDGDEEDEDEKAPPAAAKPTSDKPPAKAPSKPPRQPRA